jgi:hypothetical protein
MTTAISSSHSTTILEQPEPKGKFQHFCDWMKDHKKGIAVALLIIGIAAFTFGAGALLAIIPLSNFTVFHVGGFIVSLFSFNGMSITGLTTTGKLFFAGLGGLLFGGMVAGFGAGMLTGIPPKENQV